MKCDMCGKEVKLYSSDGEEYTELSDSERIYLCNECFYIVTGSKYRFPLFRQKDTFILDRVSKKFSNLKKKVLLKWKSLRHTS